MRSISLIALMLTLTLGLQARGIEFFEGKWQDAFELAKTEGKPIFVDAYATWCGPCKRMAKNVFTLKNVGDFYNENFVNLKLDMEKPENASFRQQYPVAAYPTLYFINPNGEVIQKKVGGMNDEGFVALGKAALSQVDRSGDYAEEYEKGNRDPDLVYNYVKALNQAGKPSQKISNEYLRSQDDLTTPQNLKFILEAAVEADSKAFGLLEKYKEQIIAISSKEAVEERVGKACDCTLKKAVEFENKELLEEAIAKVKAHCPEKAKEFALQSNMTYSKETGDAASHLKYCKKYAKTIATDADELAKLATDLGKTYKDNAAVSKFGEKISAKSVKVGGRFFHYITYAQFLKRNDKTDKAKDAAKKALALAQDMKDRRAIQMSNQLLKMLDS